MVGELMFGWSQQGIQIDIKSLMLIMLIDVVWAILHTLKDLDSFAVMLVMTIPRHLLSFPEEEIQSRSEILC